MRRSRPTVTRKRRDDAATLQEKEAPADRADTTMENLAWNLPGFLTYVMQETWDMSIIQAQSSGHATEQATLRDDQIDCEDIVEQEEANHIVPKENDFSDLIVKKISAAMMRNPVLSAAILAATEPAIVKAEMFDIRRDSTTTTTTAMEPSCSTSIFIYAFALIGAVLMLYHCAKFIIRKIRGPNSATRYRVHVEGPEPELHVGTPAPPRYMEPSAPPLYVEPPAPPPPRQTVERSRGEVRRREGVQWPIWICNNHTEVYHDDRQCGDIPRGTNPRWMRICFHCKNRNRPDSACE